MKTQQLNERGVIKMDIRCRAIMLKQVLRVKMMDLVVNFTQAAVTNVSGRKLSSAGIQYSELNQNLNYFSAQFHFMLTPSLLCTACRRTCLCSLME